MVLLLLLLLGRSFLGPAWGSLSAFLKQRSADFVDRNYEARARNELELTGPKGAHLVVLRHLLFDTASPPPPPPLPPPQPLVAFCGSPWLGKWKEPPRGSGALETNPAVLIPHFPHPKSKSSGPRV